MKKLKFHWPDCRYPPPPLPPNFKTTAYPQYADRLRNDVPPEIQMKAISMKRKTEEAAKLRMNKIRNHDTQEGGEMFENCCNLCSYTSSVIHPSPKLIIHEHTSSKLYRVNAPADKWGNYLCTTCKNTPHSHKVGVRYALILSSSLLHGWQGERDENDYAGDSLHVEQETIQGAGIRDLVHAYKVGYGNLYKPVDVLLCAGLEDVANERTTDEIMSDIVMLRNSVIGNPANPYGSFAITTLPIPPGMQEHTGQILELNEQIIEISTELNQFKRVHHAPRFHTWGLKTRRSRLSETQPRPRLHTLTVHKEGKWDGLQMDCGTKLRMGKACIQYFEDIYEKYHVDRHGSALRDRAVQQSFTTMSRPSTSETSRSRPTTSNNLPTAESTPLEKVVTKTTHSGRKVRACDRAAQQSYTTMSRPSTSETSKSRPTTSINLPTEESTPLGKVVTRTTHSGRKVRVVVNYDIKRQAAVQEEKTKKEEKNEGKAKESSVDRSTRIKLFLKDYKEYKLRKNMEQSEKTSSEADKQT